ncbi:MAG: phosphoenolpyruvate--protein phosphotransferase [Lawsonibacter sp.]|nr:phosphoenolpyruvate--protein phosphotransferase [Lawsonibacter sp.]
MEQIVAGRLCFYRRPQPQIQLYTHRDRRQELNRFYRAQKSAILELNTLYHRALHQVGEGVASIFMIHGMLLEDRDYMETVRSLIQGQGTTAEYAVQMAEISFAAAFSSMDSPYMQARAADIRDISQRMLRSLMGGRQILLMDEPAILVSDDYLPSEVMDFDQRRLLGLITRKGSLDSHSAMLVRAYHIPAIVEVDIAPKWEGHLALMDGYTGNIYLDPDAEHMEQLRELYQANGRPKGYALA